MVLRNQGQRDYAEGDVPEPSGVSLTHGSGDGICNSCRCVDEPVLRGNGRVVAEVYVVFQELASTDLAGREPKAERSWVIRRAGKRVHVVSGEAQRVSRRQGRWSGRGPRRSISGHKYR